MGYSVVETPNAKYYVLHETHAQTANLKGLNPDAIILEAADNYNSETPKKIQKYSPYISLMHSSKKPIFLGDINSNFAIFLATPISRNLALAGLLAKANVFPPLALLPAVSSSILAFGRELKLRKHLVKPIVAINSLIWGHESIGFRNALIAEKAEKLIAPQLSKKLQRKPVIAVIYGTAHAGIVEMLKYPAKRRRAISRVNISKKKYAEHAPKIFEMRFNEEQQKWEGKFLEEKIPLPRFRPLAKRAKANWRLGKQKAKMAFRRNK